MDNFAFYLYMAEQENCFPKERKNSIESAIAEFRMIKEYGLNPNDYIKEVLEKHNLKECFLTWDEINYINKAVEA